MSTSDSKYELGGNIRHTLYDHTQFTPNDNIKIFVRAKPVLRPHVAGDSSKTPGIMKPAEDDPDCTFLMRHPEPARIVEDKFRFNRILYGDCTQEEVFDEVAKPLIKKMLEGYNGCIFSYGQTGAGKTYTMFGEDSPELVGVIPRTAEYIFSSVDQTTNEVAVGCSFLEIYNERIRDIAALFSAGTDSPDSTPSIDRMFAQAQEGAAADSDSFKDMKARYNAMNLDVLQTKSGAAVVRNLTILKVSSVEDIMKMINCGLVLRETHATHMNANSSRSHTVFTIRVIQRNRVSGVAVSSELHVIDLAGSERLDDSRSSGMRLKEEIYINSSLTVLGKVISSLDPNEKLNHVPYRESKLTRILRNSLSGNSYVSVIANINPQDQWYSECISTLEFVSRCRNITINPRINYYNSAEEAANHWAGLGPFGSLPGRSSDAVEPENRLIASGTKVFWRANAAVDFFLFEHVGSNTLELIGYNSGLFLEFEHMYFAKSLLFDNIITEAKRRLQVHNFANARKPRDSEKNTSAVAHLHEQHIKRVADTPNETPTPSVELSEMMNVVAGEYVINRVVYLGGNRAKLPRIIFVNELDDIKETESPLQKAPPEQLLPISRPLNKRDKALLEAREFGKTADEIIRLEKEAAGYLAQAETLLALNSEAGMKNVPQELKGMMDQEYVDDGDDTDWVVPKRRLILGPFKDEQSDQPNDGKTHLPHIVVDQNVHTQLSKSDKPITNHPVEHLPTLSPNGHSAEDIHFSSPDSGGQLKEHHELLKVFKCFALDQYDHEEMDAFGFKKLCRDLHVTSAKFGTGAAEAAFRKVAAQGDDSTCRIRFDTLSSVLRVVAHEKPCLYDELVNTMIQNYEAIMATSSDHGAAHIL